MHVYYYDTPDRSDCSPLKKPIVIKTHLSLLEDRKSNIYFICFNFLINLFYYRINNCEKFKEK